MIPISSAPLTEHNLSTRVHSTRCAAKASLTSERLGSTTFTQQRLVLAIYPGFRTLEAMSPGLFSRPIVEGGRATRCFPVEFGRVH
jgi:hypothetical protein